MHFSYHTPIPSRPNRVYSMLEQIRDYIRTNGMSAKPRARHQNPMAPSFDGMLADRIEAAYQRRSHLQDRASDEEIPPTSLYESDAIPPIHTTLRNPYSHDSDRMFPSDHIRTGAPIPVSDQQPELSDQPGSGSNPDLDEVRHAIGEVSGNDQESMHHLFTRPPASGTAFYGPANPETHEQEMAPPVQGEQSQEESRDGFNEAILPDGGVVGPWATTASPALSSQGLEQIVEQTYQQEQFRDPMMDMPDPMMEGPGM